MSGANIVTFSAVKCTGHDVWAPGSKPYIGPLVAPNGGVPLSVIVNIQPTAWLNKQCLTTCFVGLCDLL